MKKVSRFLYLLPLLFLPLLFKGKEEKTTTVHPRISVQRKPAAAIVDTQVNKDTHRQHKLQKAMRAEPRRGNRNNSLFTGRVPQSLSHELVKMPEIKVSGGHQLLQNVGGVLTSSYHPSMGTLLLQSGGYTFFKTADVNKFSPVVQDRETGSLRVVSTIMHIRDVTPERREQILKSGAQEYYYQSNLKLLSVKTTAGSILETYSELSEQGHHVQLEAIKPGHQTH